MADLLYLKENPNMDLGVETAITNNSIYVKYKIDTILKELTSQIDTSVVSAKLFDASMLVLDFMDERYDVEVATELKLELRSKGLGDYSYKLYSVLVKEYDGFTFYLLNRETGDFDNLNGTENEVPFDIIAKKYIAYAFFDKSS